MSTTVDDPMTSDQRNLLTDLWNSDKATQGRPQLPPERVEPARDYLSRLLVEGRAEVAHIELLQELYGTKFRYPLSRRFWQGGPRPPLEAAANFRHHQLLSEETARAVAERGAEVLSPDELAVLLLNPSALWDLADLIDFLLPDYWLGCMEHVGRALMGRNGLEAPIPGDTAGERNRLIAVVRILAAEKRPDLERLKEEAKRLALRADSLWHCLLQSFSTMGRSSGWYGLIGNQENYRRITYPTLAALAPDARAAEILQVCQVAKIRMPDRKADFILGCFERVKRLGGPEKAKEKLLALPGRDAKIQFLKKFPGIGPKYSRNIMMDVYHEDFLKSIALDSRIQDLSDGLRLSFTSYDDEETFYLDVAREAGLNGWELDRLLYNFNSEVKSRLGISAHRAGRGARCGGCQPDRTSDENLCPAKGMRFEHLSSNPEIIAHLKELHNLVLSVCPNCLMKQRKEEGLIYVPPERQHAARNKNLLTMWAQGAGVRMRIMYPKPSPKEEIYDPRRRDAYLIRLQKLYAEMLS